MLTYVVTANRNRQIERMLAFKGGAQTVKLNYDPWEDDNGAVTTVEWTTKKGDAAISNTSLAASVAEAVITTSTEGASLIEVKATAGNNIHISHIDVIAKDPNRPFDDYGLFRG